MENYNKFKGQTDGVVLYVIKNKKVNTDELKAIIDDVFFEIKVGTLYSVLNRLKTKKAIDEFRISSKDGFRRKVYNLTKTGEKLFEKEYNYLFDQVVFPEKYLIVEQTSQNLEDKTKGTITTYENNENKIVGYYYE